MKIQKSAHTAFPVKHKLIGEAFKNLLEKSEGRKYMALGLDAITRSINNESRTLEFVASTEAIDRYGDSVQQDGWNLDNFQKNPVFLWGHDSTQPPIGKVISIAVKNNQLVATVQFATKDVYPFADTIFQLYRGGFLHAVSVGFLVSEYEIIVSDDDPSSPIGAVFTAMELLEISAVPIPANPEALVTDDASHVPNELERLISVVSGTPSKRNVIDQIMDALDSTGGD